MEDSSGRKGAASMPPSFIQNGVGTDVSSAGEVLIYENDIVYAWVLRNTQAASI